MAARKHLGSTWEEISERAIRSDPEYAGALLQEAVQCLLDNEIAVARGLIRQVIKATIGYEALSRQTGTPETSLVRMFGPKGSPTAAHLLDVLATLQEASGVRFEVTAVARVVGRHARGPSQVKRKPSAASRRAA